MSHFVNSPMKVKDQSALVAALQEWLCSSENRTTAAARYASLSPDQRAKFAKLLVEVHEQPQALFGYGGDVRAQRAHVIVRRQHIFGASNDVGFLKNADGTFTAIVSEFDRRQAPKLINDVAALTGLHASMAVARTRGLPFERRRDAKGRHQLVVTTR